MNSTQLIAHGCIDKIEERTTLNGKNFWQIFVAGRGDSLTRIDYFDSALFPAIQELIVGGEITCTGRLVGRLNDRGFMNYTIFGDGIFGDPAAPVTPKQSQTVQTQENESDNIPF